jgi:hypothetical protein
MASLVEFGSQTLRGSIDRLELDARAGRQERVDARLRDPSAALRELAWMATAAKPSPLQDLSGLPMPAAIGASFDGGLWDPLSATKMLAGLELGQSGGLVAMLLDTEAKLAWDLALRWRHEPSARAFGLGAMDSIRFDAGSSWIAIDSHGNVAGLRKSCDDGMGEWSPAQSRDAARLLGTLCLAAKRALKSNAPLTLPGFKDLAREGAALRQARQLEACARAPRATQKPRL